MKRTLSTEPAHSVVAFLKEREKDIESKNPAGDREFTIFTLLSNRPLTYDKPGAAQVIGGGLCDDTLQNRNEARQTSLSALTEIGTKRWKMDSVKVKEVYFQREVMPTTTLQRKPMDYQFARGDVGHEFVLVTYFGIGRYLQKVFANHVEGDIHRDYRRLACFHESFNNKAEKDPYKIYIDVDYGPHKVAPETVADLRQKNPHVLMYEHVRQQTIEGVHVILHRLQNYWNTQYANKMGHRFNGKIRYLVFDSSRAPSQPNSTEFWKISFHLIWFVEGVRFADQSTVAAFLESALNYNLQVPIGVRKPSFGLSLVADYDAKLHVNGVPLIDCAPYRNGRFFRTPFSTKLGWDKSGACPLLLPVEDLMDSTSLSIYQKTRMGGSVPFSPEIFYLGLVQVVESETFFGRKTDSTIEKIHYIIDYTPADGEKRKYKTMAKDFAESLQKAYGDEQVLSILRTAVTEQAEEDMKTLGLPEEMGSNLSPYDARALAKLSLDELYDFVCAELAVVVRYQCNILTRGNYGYCSIRLEQVTRLTVGEYEIVVYRCISDKVKNPCLVREHDRYKPHTNNTNYIVYNADTMSWYMGCHNYQCIRSFLAEKNILHTQYTNEHLKMESIKSKSKVFPVTEETPHLHFVATALCNRIKKYQAIQKELEAKMVMNQSGNTEDEATEPPVDPLVDEAIIKASPLSSIIADLLPFCNPDA